MWRGPFDNTILLAEYFCNEKGGILVLSQHLSDSATALGIEGMKSNFALSEYSKREPTLGNQVGSSSLLQSNSSPFLNLGAPYLLVLECT